MSEVRHVLLRETDDLTATALVERIVSTLGPSTAAVRKGWWGARSEPQVAIWLTGSLAKPSVIGSVSGVASWQELEAAAAVIGAEATGMPGPCRARVTASRRHNQSSLAIVAPDDLVGVVESAAVTARVSLLAVKPVWSAALGWFAQQRELGVSAADAGPPDWRRTSIDLPALNEQARLLMVVCDIEALTTIVFDGGHAEAAETYPAPESLADLASLLKRLQASYGVEEGNTTVLGVRRVSANTGPKVLCADLRQSNTARYLPPEVRALGDQRLQGASAARSGQW